MLGKQEQNRFDLGFQNEAQAEIQNLVLAQIEKSLSNLDLVIINQQWIAGIHTQSFREKLSKIIRDLGEVAEGINTAHAVYQIAHEKGIEMPIVEQIKKLLDDEVNAVEAVLSLMKRPIK